MRIKNRLVIIVFLLFAFANGNSVYAVDYYFSTLNGDDSNDGLSENSPKTSEQALQNTLQNLIAGDNVYLERGSVWYDIDLSVKGIIGSSTNEISITSYGSGELPKLVSMKKLEGFVNQGNNVWSITDENLSDRYYNLYKNINGDRYGYYNDMNFLLIDGKNYAIAKEPNGNQYFSFEEVDPNRTSYAIDNEAIWEDDYWNGAHAKICTRDWISDDVRITDFEDGRYYFQTSDWGLDEKLKNHNGSYLWIKYFVANHPNAMNIDGEWIYDHSSQRLDVYWSEDLNNSEVYQSYNDYCLLLDSCSYFNISEIEFQGGIMHTVKFASCRNMTISDCKFKYMPRMGLYIDYSYDVIVSNNIFEDGISIGIFNSFSRNSVIQDNRLNRIGCWPSMGADRDGDNKIGIKDDRRRGTTIIQRNIIDSIGYSGINVSGNYYSMPQSPAHLIIEDNDISNYCLIQTDGGGVYVFEDKYRPANTIQRISGNIIDHGHSNNSYFSSGTALTMGVYLDGNTIGFNVENNSIYNTSSGFMTNGVKDCSFIGNKIFNVGGVKSLRSGFIGHCNGFTHDGSPDENLIIKNNQIVLFDTLSAGGTWIYSSFDAAGSLADSNYYYQPFSSDSLVMNKTVNWSPKQVTFADWQRSTNFDLHSTLNKNGERFSADLGIAKDQFVKFLVNRSYNSSREVDLHNCTFEDIDGSLVSGAISLPSRSSLFLFYKSGDIDSLNLIVPDLLYDSEIPNGSQTLSISTIGSGTVNLHSGIFDYGAEVNLTATPDTGWDFLGWSGDTAGSSSSLTVLMLSDICIRANFRKIESSLKDTVAKINFSYDNTWDVDGWVNVYGASSFPLNLNSGINISLSGNLLVGDHGEPASSVVPDRVSNTYAWLRPDDNTSANFIIGGLDSDWEYSFIMYSSRDDKSFELDGLTEFSILGESKSLNSVGNNDALISFSGVKPNVYTGSVVLKMSKYGGHTAHLNALIITKDKSTSINDCLANDIDYYPVPVTDMLNMENVPARSLISVYDMVGHKVMEQRTGLGTDLQLNLSSLKTGIYLFRIIDESSVIIRNFKVVKK